MRIDWEGEIKILGKKYWAYVDYVQGSGATDELRDFGAVVEDVEVYNEDGTRATELECDLFDRLTNGDILDSLCRIKEYS